MVLARIGLPLSECSTKPTGIDIPITAGLGDQILTHNPRQPESTFKHDCIQWCSSVDTWHQID
jgi:hypothetical protein